jgi:SAM-dependent methyltransferase
MPQLQIPRFDGAVPVSFYDEDYFSGVTSNYRDAYTYERFGYLFQCLAECLIRSYPLANSFLDIGCASGFLVQALREREVLAWGIDCSAYAISQADEGTRPYLTCANLETVEFPVVDIVVACETLEHLAVDQLGKLLPRLMERTMCGLFATMPMPSMLNGLGWEEAQAEPTHVSLYDRPWWTATFQQAGWRVGVHEVLAAQYFQNHPLILAAGWCPFVAGVPDER